MQKDPLHYTPIFYTAILKWWMNRRVQSSYISYNTLEITIVLMVDIALHGMDWWFSPVMEKCSETGPVCLSSTGALYNILPQLPRREVWPRGPNLLLRGAGLEELPKRHVRRQGTHTQYSHDTHIILIRNVKVNTLNAHMIHTQYSCKVHTRYTHTKQTQYSYLMLRYTQTICKKGTNTGCQGTHTLYTHNTNT
jgi:hypothetical protein